MKFIANTEGLCYQKMKIVVIGTQYDAIDDVKNILRLSGVDVERYLNQGTLFIIDAQKGYQDVDSHGLWKFAMSLLSRIKKEGRQGVYLVWRSWLVFQF